MALETTIWQVRDNDDDGEVRALLERDRVWNSFALADLLPPFRSYARFHTAARPGEKPSALVLIIEHPGFTTISPFGNASGVEAILAQANLPPRALVQMTADHRALLEAVYCPISPWREMLRMAVTAQTFMPCAASEPVLHLAATDLAEISDLYRLFPESQFRPDLLDQGSYYGLRAHGRLCAIAGTHVVTEPFGIAVVGSVFTHPEERGKGYASMVTSAVVSDLLERGCRDVVLNVFATNTSAIGVYRRLGFQTYHHLWSGLAERHPEA